MWIEQKWLNRKLAVENERESCPNMHTVVSRQIDSCHICSVSDWWFLEVYYFPSALLFTI